MKERDTMRELKIMFNSDVKGTYTTRISLPKTWIAQMGITKEEREVIVKFEDSKIIIEKKSDKIEKQMNNK